MISEFLQFQTLLRLYHWNTTSYARHVASGNLYEKLDPLIDAFIETMQGQMKSGRIHEKPFKLSGKTLSDKDAVKLLKQFVTFLTSLKLSSSDLQNLRDEMLTEVQRTQYLFSLRH